MINADFNNGEEAIPASMLKSLIVERVTSNKTQKFGIEVK